VSKLRLCLELELKKSFLGFVIDMPI